MTDTPRLLTMTAEDWDATAMCLYEADERVADLKAEVLAQAARVRALEQQLAAETNRADSNVAVYDDLKRRFDSGTTGLLAGVELIRSLQVKVTALEQERERIRQALEAEIRGDGYVGGNFPRCAECGQTRHGGHRYNCETGDRVERFKQLVSSLPTAGERRRK